MAKDIALSKGRENAPQGPGIEAMDQSCELKRPAKVVAGWTRVPCGYRLTHLQSGSQKVGHCARLQGCAPTLSGPLRSALS